MRTERDPGRNRNRDYIPNDEIDREEKADIRQQKKGNMFSVLMGGVVVISLIAFLFVLLDSGVLSGEAQRIYGSPQTSSGAGGGEMTQEEKKAAEEEARKAEEEAKQKKREQEEAKRAEEEAARKAQEEEEEKAREEEERKKAEEREEKQAEIDKKEAKRKKELEEEQKVLSGDYILPESNTRYCRIFTGEEFRRYFESKSWYKGTIPAEEFDANQNERFNEYEKANISLLVKVAQERGIR